MVGFGHKQAWLAIHDGDRGATAAALDLRDLGPVSWRSGIDLAYLTDDRVVLTPPLPGVRDSRWLIVTGRWLLGDVVDVGELSGSLHTEVQFFATHRVTELHRWERAVNGTTHRAFEYVGEIGKVTDWWGEPDAHERAIGLPATQDENVDVLVSENDVMRLAAAWSINPMTLDGRPAPGPLHAAAASATRRH